MQFDFPKTPAFTFNSIAKIIEANYGFKAKITPLDSYMDLNFHLVSDFGQEFILKIANHADAFDSLDAQNKALDFLYKRNWFYHCPTPIQGKSGFDIVQIKGDDGEDYNVRMLRFLRGKLLADVDPQAPELLSDLGKFAASLDKTLKDFSHHGAHRQIPWDLKNALQVENLVGHIKEVEDRRIIEYFLTQFELFVLPRLLNTRSSVIHNDINDYNILIRDPSAGLPRIYGIFDFGDLTYTHTICELAIAITYVMLEKEEPFKAASHVIQGYHQIYPLTETEVEILFHLSAVRLCISVIMSAFRRKQHPENEYLGITEPHAWKLLKRMVATSPEHITDLFLQSCGFKPKDRGYSPKKIIKSRKNYLGKSLSVAYDEPFKIVRGSLQYLFDNRGKSYLDCVNNVSHVGHCHPAVVRAVNSQNIILNTNTRYLHDNIVKYAEKLTAIIPDPLKVCFFVNSGSEANDLALRIARTVTDRNETITLEGAYHGTSIADIEVSPYKYAGKGGPGRAEHIHEAPVPDMYRGAYGDEDGKTGKKYAELIQKKIDEIEKSGNKLSAFICESIIGCGGQIVLPENYLKDTYKMVRKAGGLCIADEVQTGFGRVGSHMWAFEAQDVVPDILTLGKPMGNGHPLAAVITTREIADMFANGMEYFNTFGGNPVSCAAGLAVLEVIENEGLQKHAEEIGGKLIEGLKKLQEHHSIIGDVRGLGLFIGIELVRDRKTKKPADIEANKIVNRIKDEGILLSADGPLHNVLKIKPPVIFNEENADRLIATLDNVLKGLL